MVHDAALGKGLQHCTEKEEPILSGLGYLYSENRAEEKIPTKHLFQCVYQAMITNLGAFSYVSAAESVLLYTDTVYISPHVHKILYL